MLPTAGWKESNRYGQNGILRYEQPAYVKGAAFKNQSFEN
jgi:hypothetical protein